MLSLLSGVKRVYDMRGRPVLWLACCQEVRMQEGSLKRRIDNLAILCSMHILETGQCSTETTFSVVYRVGWVHLRFGHDCVLPSTPAITDDTASRTRRPSQSASLTCYFSVLGMLAALSICITDMQRVASSHRP